jgi:tetratricopeptide (TPR) repeat protein
MSKIVKFPVSTPPQKLGPKKVRKRKRINLEDFGQLNLFAQAIETRVISLHQAGKYFEEALSLDESNDPRAEEFYLLAITHNQSRADAYCNLGIMKNEAQKSSEAINYLTKCLELDPRHFEAHYNLANLYSDLGNLPLAKVHYEVAIQIQPDFPNCYFNIGLVLVSMKRFNEAIDSIKKYIELSPDTDHHTAKELINTLTGIG